jgi:DNA-binding GntR family transcriptional regulator
MPSRGRAQSRYVLANQILGFVREDKIANEQHLVETALSERLGVSRTLVRAALKLLAERGVVEARRHQGFFLTRGWRDLEDHAIDVPLTAEDELYRRLVHDRISGDLPERITQVALIERYRVDRGLLLRVLSRMSDEAIVVKNKGHGWTFLPAIDTDVALRASYDFRRTIEPAGILLASFAPDAGVLERLRQAHLAIADQVETASEQRLYALDVAFHETLAAFTNNSFWLQAIQQQNRLRRLLEYEGASDRRRVRDWVKEHLGIIAALRAGRLELASERLAAHLEKAYRATQGRSAPGYRGADGGRTASQKVSSQRSAQRSGSKRTPSPGVAGSITAPPS